MSLQGPRPKEVNALNMKKKVVILHFVTVAIFIITPGVCSPDDHDDSDSAKLQIRQWVERMRDFSEYEALIRKSSAANCGEVKTTTTKAKCAGGSDGREGTFVGKKRVKKYFMSHDFEEGEFSGGDFDADSGDLPNSVGTFRPAHSSSSLRGKQVNAATPRLRQKEPRFNIDNVESISGGLKREQNLLAQEQSLQLRFMKSCDLISAEDFVWAGLLILAQLIRNKA